MLAIAGMLYTEYLTGSTSITCVRVRVRPVRPNPNLFDLTLTLFDGTDI